MIKKLYSLLVIKLRSFGWKRDSRLARKRFRCLDSSALKNELDGRILILAPHSDDEWIGCAPLLERFNCIVCSMDMPGGNDEETRELRYKEMELISRQKNYDLVRLDSNNRLSGLKRLILEQKPNYISVPFFVDWHQDHIQTMECLKQALEDYSCKILMYQVSCPIPSDAINCAIPIEKNEWVEKWNLFRKTYKSQRCFPWRRFAFIERAQGAYCGSYASSVFCVVDSKQWKGMFDKIPNSIEKEKMRNGLNDILANISYIEQLWIAKKSL